MQEKLDLLLEDARVKASEIKCEADYLNIKSMFLGKKSLLSEYMASIKDMSNEDKKIYGPLFNKVKKELEELFSQKLEEAENSSANLDFDPTIPVNLDKGSLHPITIVGREVTDILKNMGFMILSGPEMDSEYYNFEALNIPKSHPARDMQDTYYLDNGMLLRTQTSALQIRGMKKYGVPLKACAPGRCFRNEDLDACHENTFFQMEGIMIDENISIANLIYFMKTMLSEVFGQEVEVRLRPGFFPFVEPGFELDIKCLICGGDGCPSCKDSGWLELCPCGMIHPKVLEYGGIDTEKYTGFAFGLGLTRLAMMKYGIKDIRTFNSGNLKAFSQFKTL